MSSAPESSRAPTATEATVGGESAPRSASDPSDTRAASPEEALRAGREAAARYAWQETFSLLTAADAAGLLEAADLETLAEAAWWTGHAKATLETAERAYAAHLEAGDTRRAGYVALLLSREHQHRLAHAIAAGWFSRAERLLEQVPDSAEHGYLVMANGVRALGAGDAERALELCRRAVDIGSRFGDRDLQALALHNEGSLLVTRGQVVEGLALLDEATAAAVSGELRPSATAVIYCNTIGICRDLADFRRAGEWTDAAKRWCERQAISGFPGVCRIRRAEVMRLRGAFAEAEQEVRQACGELEGFLLDVMGEGFYELGEIRLRVGDLAGAGEAFRQAHELGREPQPGLALLRLAEGKLEVAGVAIRRALADETWDRLLRARLLPAQVEIALAVGERETARSAAEELEAISLAYGSSAFEALARMAAGAVALAEGDASAAQRSLRRALQLWREVDAPYEAARTRELLAGALRADGDSEGADLELAAARSAFERIGAALDARRVAQRLAAAGAGAPAAPRAERTFMFTDIVKSTNLIEAIGDDAWEDLLRWHDVTLRAAFAAHGGEEIKQAGDGFFVGFADPGTAIDCAVAIQRMLAEHRRAHGFAPQVRIGLHAAEAARRGLDYGGKGVHEAARIAALAEGGEILVSRATHAAVEDRFTASPPRGVALKGISQAVEVVTIEWR